MKEFNKQYIYQNFNRNNKWIGIIDYKSLLVIIIYVFCVFAIIRLLHFNMKVSIYLFIGFTVPVISIIVIHINNDVAIDVIIVIITFYIKKKFFVHKSDVKGYRSSIIKK